MDKKHTISQLLAPPSPASGLPAHRAAAPPPPACLPFAGRGPVPSAQPHCSETVRRSRRRSRFRFQRRIPSAPACAAALPPPGPIGAQRPTAPSAMSAAGKAPGGRRPSREERSGRGAEVAVRSFIVRNGRNALHRATPTALSYWLTPARRDALIGSRFCPSAARHGRCGVEAVGSRGGLCSGRRAVAPCAELGPVQCR